MLYAPLALGGQKNDHHETKETRAHRRHCCAYVCPTEDTLTVPVNYVKHILFVANADGRERSGRRSPGVGVLFQ